jgi:hypothetical protein
MFIVSYVIKMIDLCPVCNEKGVQLRVAGHRSLKMRPTDNAPSSIPAPILDINEVKPLEIEVIVGLEGDSTKRFFSSSVAHAGVEYTEYIPPKSTPAMPSKKKTIVTTSIIQSNAHVTAAPEDRSSVEESSIEITSQPTKKPKTAQREKLVVGVSFPDSMQPLEEKRSGNVWEQQQQESSVGGGAKKSRVLCPHGRQKSRCRDCGGVAFCMHGRIRYDCRECSSKKWMISVCNIYTRRFNLSSFFTLVEGNIKVKTSRFCVHGRSRYLCVECKGTGLCVHEIERRVCKECKG